ncbi:MAG: 30S ribosomal protein S3 [Candidatus Thermoplasmatota archaeon]|nr:30S ribosomal protein S3 [Candidatus Thermoplasmatota archaeon]
MTTIAREMVEERVRRMLVHDFVRKEVDRAGFGGLSIQRTPLGTHVRILAERPGIVIGRKGVDINRLTEELERTFGYENLQVEAGDVENWALNPDVMASKVTNALERGWNYRRAGNSMLQRIMGAGARGCQITIAGKLTGLRHRTEKFIEGHIKHCGEPALQLMQVGYSQAKLKPGTIGVKVVIMPPDAKLPDEIDVAPAVVEQPSANEEGDAVTEGEETAPANDKQASAAKSIPEEEVKPDADTSEGAAKTSAKGKTVDAAEAPKEVTQPEAKVEDSK